MSSSMSSNMPSRAIRIFYFILLCTLSASGYTESSSESPNAQKTHSIISHGLAMHGEPKYPAGFKGFEYTSDKAKKGGNITLFSLGTFDSLNPYIPKGNAADKLGLIYDSLTVQASDEAFSQYGLIAEKVEYPIDRSWIIFHLRPEAKFHDGKKISAEDVVFTFNLLMEKGDPSYRFYYADVSEVTALDSQRVKFTFANSNNKELPLVVGQLPVLPKHFWQDKEFDRSSLELPLGSGPYQIHSVDPGRSIVYQRNKDYWAAELAVNRGSYNFDQIKIDYYRDDNVSIEALKAGEYDFRWENSSKFWATAYDVPAINDGVLIKQEVAHEATSGMQAFVFNLRRPLFKDRRIRQAIAYAFDFEWSNQALFYNAYQRGDSFFANSELAARGLPQGRELEILEPWREQLPSDVFSQPYLPPKTDGSGRNRPNLRKAKKLLDEAGYKVVDNQLMTPDGQAFHFEIMLISQQFERIVNPFIKSLQKLGITVDIRLVDTSQYINRMRSFDFDMMTQVFPQSLSPGNEQAEFWGSRAAKTNGSRNLVGIENPVIDAVTQGLINASSREELIYHTRALDRILLHQHYVVPQWYKASSRLVYWDKFSRPEISPKYDRYYTSALMTWWHDSEKAERIKAYKTGSQ